MINFYKKLQNIFKSKQDKAKNKFVLNPEYFKEKNVPINLNNEQAREVACMYNDVRNAILRFSKNPVAFEALWDGDTSGWFLDLFVVFEGDNDSEKYYSKSIYILTFGTDMRVFQTENPFWSESTVAKLIGEEISKSFNIPFWFPSPDEATSECPHWFEQDRAVKCINCAKPFLIKSQYLSKSVCYHCQLRIERKEKERETEIKKSENFKPLHELGYIFAVLKNNRVIDKGFIRHDSKCMKFLYRDFQEIGFKKKDFLSTFSDISYSTDECKQLIKRINEYID
ncbi:MAG: hypothetical protein SFU98_11900, partial [Leptospiraceae bacterium]|nr:hypothetical protein [Leptospiraceae bacterium]